MQTVDEEMDGVASEQRERLEAIEAELEDVRRELGHVWHLVENTDVDMARAAERTKEHQDRREILEDAAAAARAVLAQRRSVLDDMNTIADYANDMRDFPGESELTERRTFLESFVKEIVVMPGDALIRYAVPMSEDSLLPGGVTEKAALKSGPLTTAMSGSDFSQKSPPGRTRNRRVGCQIGLPSRGALCQSPTPEHGARFVAWIGVETSTHLSITTGENLIQFLR